MTLRRISLFLSSPLLFSYTTLINNSIASEFKSSNTSVFSCSRTFLPSNKVTENTPFSLKMAWYCSAGSNDDLINNLKAAKIIKSERVEKAMKAVDRKHYVSQVPYK